MKIEYNVGSNRFDITYDGTNYSVIMYEDGFIYRDLGMVPHWYKVLELMRFHKGSSSFKSHGGKYGE